MRMTRPCQDGIHFGRFLIRNPVASDPSSPSFSPTSLKWFNNQKPSFLQNYRECRRLRPEQPFYILSPSFQWDLWDIIQENSLMDIQPNTPSSGMLGVAVMMNLCEQVSVYEFLPSHRKTELCHYFEKDKNWQCTMGHYHPLKFEKDIVKRLHQGTEYDIYNSGKIKLCGFSQHSCP
ncbi:hypothetical protein MATL_G00022960 [Megalops atlanticus]|uniref:beta-galactoside alpha-(2,6)-sialyltransferase n=1 Tax=Megalops atlanticus TaxID=7932 RepID=A0A9D3QCT6_MEGAT|nr:hypothetical protein MATL_G00022960 [Megalops atlanticus]